jgi:GTPase SAR1 family protein
MGEFGSEEPHTESIMDLVLDGHFRRLSVMEVPPKEPLISMNEVRNNRIRVADAFILAFNPTYRYSFEDLHTYLAEIRELKDRNFDFPIVVVGTKIDLVAEREVASTAGANFARRCGGKYIETSCDDMASVDHAFCTLIREIDRWEAGERFYKSRYPERIEKTYDKPQRRFWARK